MSDLENHRHTPRDGSWWVRDGHGIELARVCDECHDAKLAQFRPDVLDAYDTDEPIDGDGDWFADSPATAAWDAGDWVAWSEANPGD